MSWDEYLSKLEQQITIAPLLYGSYTRSLLDLNKELRYCMTMSDVYRAISAGVAKISAEYQENATSFHRALVFGYLDTVFRAEKIESVEAASRLVGNLYLEFYERSVTNGFDMTLEPKVLG